MEFIPGRTLEKGQKVRVYVNLHKGGRFSIVDAKSGLVCGYTENCLLSEATFFVSQSGRKKVMEQQKKFVHAWVKGIYEDDSIEQPLLINAPVVYNPYKHESFCDQKGNPVYNSTLAYLSNKKVFIPNEE